jgi:hypothetical protein
MFFVVTIHNYLFSQLRFSIRLNLLTIDCQMHKEYFWPMKNWKYNLWNLMILVENQHIYESYRLLINPECGWNELKFRPNFVEIKL